VADKKKTFIFDTLDSYFKSWKKNDRDLLNCWEPNENGEIEIGYGTYDEFHEKGFTEIVGELLNGQKAKQL
jgi:hypothetical protein